MPEPWRFFTADRIASTVDCRVENVRENWPKLVDQLARCAIDDRPTQIAAIGTIAIETGPWPSHRFTPVREAYYLGDSAEAYRRTLRYYPHYARGFVGLTWASNYQTYTAKLRTLWGGGPDLEAELDAALESDVSAACLALYFRDHGGDGQARIPQAARAGNWREVRRLVQGGDAGLDHLERIAATLSSTPAPVTADGYVFPVDGYDGAIELHWGTFPGASDLFAPRGTPVRAIHSGTVVYREVDGALGGNAVQIAGDDRLQSYYAHGDRAPAVAMGARVQAGDYLFGVGDTGNAKAAGPHLHFGMGKTILTGSGPQGGAGSDFDAVALLRSLRVVKPPQPAPPAYAEPGQVGSGLLELMRADGTEPALPSTWLPLGAPTATVEECIGLNGTRYVWHLKTGRHWRYPAA